MITRYIFGLPMIDLVVGEIPIEAIIDTGFNGALCLPLGIIKQLGLPRIGSFHYILANGDLAKTDTYYLDFEWLGKKRGIDIISSHDEIALLGMELLEDTKTVLDPRKNILTIEKSV